ncbi:MAG: TnsA endonuclease N-terminal domain-containing protein [Sporomusaceae bacterium]|nr:TnsA endonuclease N-terminal domain-containing protein [Sporomusaceae bacterium]
MMDDQEYRKWVQMNLFTDFADKRVSEIRSSPPSRNCVSGQGNVHGAYPSRKMNVTIQYESHTVERSFLLEYEHDSDVLEFYDQPGPIQVSYKTPSGRNVTAQHTPDYFVIRTQCAGWEEVKPEAKLQELAKIQPNRYERETDGTWRSRPAEKYAEQYGLYYRIRVDSEINVTLTDNYDYLRNYMGVPESVDLKQRTLIKTYVEQNEGISLLNVKRSFPEAVDDINNMIVAREIYVDLETYSLRDLQRVPVFSKESIAEITDTPQEQQRQPPFITPIEGETIFWDGVSWEIVNAGGTGITLKSEKGQVGFLAYPDLEKLVNGRLIVPGPSTRVVGGKTLQNASESMLKKALERLSFVERYLKTGEVPAHVTSLRTLQRWAHAYNDAKRTLGSGLLGLIPSEERRGNRSCKLPAEVNDAVNDFIVNQYESKRGMGPSAVYGLLKEEFARRNIKPPSFPTFCARVIARPIYEQVKKRFGKRAAYKHKPFIWFLGPSVPRHGSFFMHICHVDHTELDIELENPETGIKKKPWATFLMCAYTRTLLAVYITFAPPSRVSVMMVLRECVRRWNRLPQVLVTDGGKEFHSNYTECLLARYDVEKKVRPPAQPRWGSVCERLFGTANTQFVHNLIGNTKIMKQVRLVTKSINPKNLAVWTLKDFNEAIMEWAYEAYDTNEHSTLGMSPRQAREMSARNHGRRDQKIIRFDDFYLNSMMPVRTGTVTVNSTRGVLINRLPYWHNSFGRLHGEKVEAYYDPFNAGVAYARINGKVVELRSPYYNFENYDYWDVKAATEELISKGITPNGKSISTHLAKSHQKEEEQREQGEAEVLVNNYDEETDSAAVDTVDCIWDVAKGELQVYEQF